MIPLDPHAARIVHLQSAITTIGRAIGCPDNGTAEILGFALKLGRKGMYYTVEWSDRFGLWMGTCSDYPELAHCDITPSLALEGIRALVPVAVDVEDAA